MIVEFLLYIQLNGWLINEMIIGGSDVKIEELKNLNISDMDLIKKRARFAYIFTSYPYITTRIIIFNGLDKV